MSATLAPFGLRPAFHPSGLDRAQALANGIEDAFASDILKGQAIKYVAASGTIEPVTATGDSLSGAFAGVEWTDTTGRRRVSNYWPALTSYQTGSCVAYFYNDPNIVYEIQADGPVEQTAVGLDANLSNFAAGSNTTGLSQATLDAGILATGVQGQVQVLDIAPYPGNNWDDGTGTSDPYTIVRVQIAKRQIAAVVPGI
jgi:hypothetical protein